MARKSKGYIELFWDCPRCGSRNPGLIKVCDQCGAPQPEDVEFYQAEKQELITDAEKLQAAKKGPDIHCPYCGARNPADAETCSQCGGDLTTGFQREAGHVVGAFQEGKAELIQCPNCGAENPSDRAVCDQCGAALRSEAEIPQPKPIQEPTVQSSLGKGRSKIGLILLAVFVTLCAALVVFLVFANRTESVRGTVEGVRWERSVIVEELVPVEYTEWQDQVPSGAEIISCELEVRNVQDEPVDNSVEVCGTPYTVETGSGAAEVVQDCEYHVMDEFCTYTSMEWQAVDRAVVSGTDYSGYWPDPELTEDQQLGEREEEYQVFFETGDGTRTYTTRDYELFQQFQIGTQWGLNVNSFGTVNSVDP